MRIFGIGIDIVETARISDSIERFGDKFLDRIYTAKERAYCDKMRFAARHYAARFAAKEAISKTFGTGIGESVGWTDMEILRQGTGEPYVLLHGDGREFATQNGITRVMISLSHADEYAAANAVAICD
jgi:holo-[acyl-carrier protein] synthase